MVVVVVGGGGGGRGAYNSFNDEIKCRRTIIIA